MQYRYIDNRYRNYFDIQSLWSKNAWRFLMKKQIKFECEIQAIVWNDIQRIPDSQIAMRIFGYVKLTLSPFIVAAHYAIRCMKIKRAAWKCSFYLFNHIANSISYTNAHWCALNVASFSFFLVLKKAIVKNWERARLMRTSASNRIR